MDCYKCKKESGGPKGPFVLFSRAFFTRLKDATDYAREEYSGTRYYWEIRHISEAMPKRVALDPASL